MGLKGLKQVALESHKRTAYLRSKLLETGVFEEVNSQPFFKEFVLRSKVDSDEVLGKLKENGILGGLDLGKVKPELKNQILICATEKRTKSEIDAYVQVVEGMR
jgi:glycine dehydrogenase subunit 1